MLHEMLPEDLAVTTAAPHACVSLVCAQQAKLPKVGGVLSSRIGRLQGGRR
jgi:hypothetical protein